MELRSPFRLAWLYPNWDTTKEVPKCSLTLPHPHPRTSTMSAFVTYALQELRARKALLLSSLELSGGVITDDIYPIMEELALVNPSSGCGLAKDKGKSHYCAMLPGMMRYETPFLVAPLAILLYQFSYKHYFFPMKQAFARGSCSLHASAALGF